MPEQTRTCRDCPRQLWQGNRSGYCRSCKGRRQLSDPAEQARRHAKQRKTYASDPAVMEAARQRIAEARKKVTRPDAEQMRILGEAGNRAQPKGSPSRMRAGLRITAHRLAWCPHHLRGDYLFLTKRKRIPTAEARQIIERQHEAEMLKFHESLYREAAP